MLFWWIVNSDIFWLIVKVGIALWLLGMFAYGLMWAWAKVKGEE